MNSTNILRYELQIKLANKVLGKVTVNDINDDRYLKNIVNMWKIRFHKIKKNRNLNRSICRGFYKIKNNMNLKLIIRTFNEDTRIEFENLPTKRKDNEWFQINGVDVLQGKYKPEQQLYAVKKCREIGIRATSRLLEVSRRILQRWCRRFNVSIPRYPPRKNDWRERKIRKRNFWRLRGY